MALNINNFVTFNETVKLTTELKGWVRIHICVGLYRTVQVKTGPQK